MRQRLPHPLVTHTPQRAWLGQWQPTAFPDGAHVKITNMPYAPRSEQPNLASVGAGLNRTAWSGSMRTARRGAYRRPTDGTGRREPRASLDAGEQGSLTSTYALAETHPASFTLKMVNGPERGR
jgi:hypothetical protein